MAKSKQPHAGASWLASLRWSRQAPKSLRQAAASDPSAFAVLLAERLTDRKGRLAAASNGLASAKPTSPYLLGASGLFDTAARSGERIERLYECSRKTDRPVVKKQVKRWLDQHENGSRAESAVDTLELLAWCDALPRLAPGLSAQRFLRLFQQIVVSLNGAVETSFEPGKAKARRHEDARAEAGSHELQAVLEAELLLTAACLLPELAGAEKLRSRSAQMLRGILEQMTDGNGVPTAGALPLLPPIMASLLRCATLADRNDLRPWSSGAQGRYEKLLRQAPRFIRPDGRFAFSDSRSAGQSADSQAGTRDAVLATLLERAARHGRKKQKRAGSKHEFPAIHSERSQVAILRSDWSAKADWLAVNWHQATPELELFCAGKPVLEGLWQFELQVDGSPLQGAEPYEMLCWVSDEDLDYLELRCRFDGGGTLERHFFLSRHDRFALLADSVMAPAGARVDLSATLPLAPGARLDSDRQMRGGWLRREKKKVARLAPLWLPQYRVEGTPGALEEEEGRLVMKASAPGRRFCMPLMLDWGKHGSRPAVEWRRLSVAENRRAVPGDRAVGFRFRVGDHQLLFYRSLGPRAMRSVLGHQTRHQLVLGRFDEDGDVEPLLEVI